MNFHFTLFLEKTLGKMCSVVRYDNYFIQDKSNLFLFCSIIPEEHRSKRVRLIFVISDLVLMKINGLTFFLSLASERQKKMAVFRKNENNFPLYQSNFFSNYRNFFRSKICKSMKKSGKFYDSFRNSFCWLNIVNSIFVKKKKNRFNFEFEFWILFSLEKN